MNSRDFLLGMLCQNISARLLKVNIVSERGLREIMNETLSTQLNERELSDEEWAKMVEWSEHISSAINKANKKMDGLGSINPLSS